MRLLPALLLLLAATAACAAEDQPKHQHGDGGCEAFPWDISRELDLLRAAPIAVTASASSDAGANDAPLDRRLELTLKPAAEVRTLAEPGRTPGPDTYAGLLRLHLPRTGDYRISSDQRLWIDVIGPRGLVQSTKFAMQPGCDKLHKSVAFRLDPEVDYWIQISGSPMLNAVLLITLDR